ncbi:MAG TPA: hypothetical protein DEF51_02550, partial [Myxococcales bacterium]|nr:hypothetical protein [Myxococcales bacterium]
DCGGATACPRCPDGQGCATPADCVTGMCTMGFCGDCPGVRVGGRCVYLPTTVSSTNRAAAAAACSALGPTWSLCSAAELCDPATHSYLASSGCGCGGGAATCACGSAANLYIHVTGSMDRPYYVRGAGFPGCIAGSSCTSSVSETCGVALCCR